MDWESEFDWHVHIVVLPEGALLPFITGTPRAAPPPGAFAADRGPRRGANVEHMITVSTSQEAEALKRGFEDLIETWGLAEDPQKFVWPGLSPMPEPDEPRLDLLLCAPSPRSIKRWRQRRGSNSGSAGQRVRATASSRGVSEACSA
jgi:hypothetical protein